MTLADTHDVGTFVYDFDEYCEQGRALLGGKGLGLAEMTQIGLPIPRGFTITTAACRSTMSHGPALEGLDAEIDRHLAHLELQTAKRLGDPDRPLLLSVRSGGPISMPGMMETILNLGLNGELAAAVAERTGNRRFAYDAYRRLIQMYGEVVAGIDPGVFESAIAWLKSERGIELDSELDADDFERLATIFEELYREATSAKPSRPMREPSWPARCARSSNRGTLRVRASTGTSTTSPTSSEPPST